MKFSIIIPFFNEEEKIKILLESLNTIDYDKQDYEVIFVNNKSTDNTPAIIKSYGYSVENAPKIASSYYSRNIGTSCADGEYLLFIDADCVVDKSILREYSKYINLQTSTNYIYAGEILPHTNTGNNFENYAANRKILNQKSAATGWSYKPFAQTANALFLKDHVIFVDGFNEQMTSGGDAEICWRIFENFQTTVIYAQTALVYHQHRKDAINFAAQFKKYGQGRVQQIFHSIEYSNNKKTEDVTAVINACIDLHNSIEASAINDQNIINKSIDVLKEAAYIAGYIYEIHKFLGSNHPNGSYSTLHEALTAHKK